MKILVIGGSYFLGRVFTIVASNDHELTLVNRGKYSMTQFGVREFVADRYEPMQIAKLPEEEFDVVVDFCAYNPQDIEYFIKNFRGTFKKYIFISTCDVYQRNTQERKDENALLENRVFQGEVGGYILGKVVLEKEIVRVSKEKGFDYGVIRPTIIYGPYNYAQKESEYVKMIVHGQKIPMPFDSNSKFQMVYVKDVANAILEVAKQEGNSVYNVCGEEVMYEDFFDILTEVAGKENVQLDYMTVNKILQEEKFAPFPLTLEETELYDGTKITKECNFEYTSIREGMDRTFKAFRNVYTN